LHPFAVSAKKLNFKVGIVLFKVYARGFRDDEIYFQSQEWEFYPANKYTKYASNTFHIYEKIKFI
jgi:hypothetical protein